MAEGIEVRHANGCRALAGGRCSCEPMYRASVWSNRERKRIRKTFSSAAQAKTWRADALVALSKGVLRAPKPVTLQQAWSTWYEGAQDGSIRNRSGDQFKPSALRAYEGAMRLRVLPALGSVRLAEIDRPALQEFADALLAEGLSPSAIQVALLPVRAIYRRAISRGELVMNPCSGLQLPAVRGRRERYASADEAEKLIAAAPARDREVWATAMYAGLRLGELRALRVDDVDLASGVIHVERGWDPAHGEIKLKSHAGRRKVPVVGVLRDHLLDLLGRSGRSGADLVFGRTPESPFAPNMLQRRADKAWSGFGMLRLTPHECRHTFASLMIAAGVNAKALSTFMGHAKIGITLDRYGHLMPGSEEEAAGLLSDYLDAQRARQEDRARAAAANPSGQSRDNGTRIRRLEATRGDSKTA